MITLEKVCKMYREAAHPLRGQPARCVEALRAVDLTVAPGDYLSITGASGSGKTTLMHILGLLDTPTAGRYLLDGCEVSALTPGERAQLRSKAIGFVFQSFRLLNELTALENAALPLTFQGVSRAVREKRAAELLTLVGLGERMWHRPAALSGGQQQRVAIARALAAEPRVLLADEPTAGLDPAATGEVLALFDRLHAEGHTIILITHSPLVAARSKRRAVIENGLLKEENCHDQTR